MAPPPTLPNASSKLCHIPSQLSAQLTRKHHTWDPFSASGDDHVQPSHIAISRVKRDLLSLYNDPPPGLFVIADESDMMLIHAIIMGTVDTPYEGGFFYFVLKCPPDYPIRPPRVRLMTTAAGTCRFNPNLYKTGKVCLSILGTWDGPAWSPAQQISSLLISIQSLLNENPYHNEPGFERERSAGDIKCYNEVIEHETIRVAVCGMLENDCMLNLPASLRQVMEKTFLQYYDHYVTVANKNAAMDNTPMHDPFGDDRGRFQYKALLVRLEKLREKLTEKHGNVDSPMHDSFYPSLVGVEESTDDTHDELYEGELSDDSKASDTSFNDTLDS